MHENEKWFKDMKRIATLSHKSSTRILKDLALIKDDRCHEARHNKELQKEIIADIKELKKLFEEWHSKYD